MGTGTAEPEESGSQRRWDLREKPGPKAGCVWKKGRSLGKVYLGFISVLINRRKEKSHCMDRSTSFFFPILAKKSQHSINCDQ